MTIKCSVFIAISLDGFIAREDGSIDWLMKANELAPEGEDGGYHDFIAGVDAIIMGRHSFDMVKTFDPWPYKLPVIVLSSQKLDIPDDLKDKVVSSSETPTELKKRLSIQGMRHLYIDGGITIQRFLNEGCADELIITIIPILLGRGRRLFGDLSQDIHLQLINSRVLRGGFTQIHYQVN
ncbi:MAG: dihydrofolate reductase [Gammaproteobacteria bacterium]|nr:dihydrofolate reductase [Gammaproteobacteria bacterium]